MKMFNKSKNEIVENNERREILECLYQVDRWNGCSENKEHYQLILDKVLWLWEKLELSKLEQLAMEAHSKYNNVNVMGLPLNGYITARQLCCLKYVQSGIRDSQIQAAYHELCDFIHNYNQTKTEPINYFEKFVLSFAIKEFESVINKILKEGQ